jgi:alpha-tubulin suppressor-like RCC1 family protein
MADRFPGGVISKTPPSVSGPAPGTGGAASGVWTLDEVLGYVQAGIWPGAALPLPNLYAWGSGFNGALGTNSVVYTSSPVQVGELDDWAQASAGTGVLALTTGNALYAWGDNGGGSVGDGTTVSKSSPVQIGALTNWSQVSAGGYGRLGHGDTVSRSSPVQVGALTNWAQVSAGYFNTVCDYDGRELLLAWGSNVNGSLGLGDSFTAARSSPVQVGALTNWAQVSTVNRHTACVKTDGTLWAWGSGGEGRLGHGDTVSRSSPVQVGALTNWAQVAVGYNGFTACVTTDRHPVYVGLRLLRPPRS